MPTNKKTVKVKSSTSNSTSKMSHKVIGAQSGPAANVPSTHIGSGALFGSFYLSDNNLVNLNRVLYAKKHSPHQNLFELYFDTGLVCSIQQADFDAIKSRMG